MAKKPKELPTPEERAKQLKELKALCKKIDQLKGELSGVVADIQKFEKDNR